MPEKLEEKTENQSRIVNDLYKRRGDNLPKKPRLYDYYVDLYKKVAYIFENFPKTFTP